MALSVGCLSLVWMVNFLIVLPVVNPEFVHYLPMGTTLISKMLFGAAMGAILEVASNR